MSRYPGAPKIDSAQHHRDWLALVEVSGPFLSLPVLRATWPTLDAIEPAEREELRRAHSTWQVDPAAGQWRWIEYILRDQLDWGAELRTEGLANLAIDVPEHDTTLTPSFALVEPGSDADAVKPKNTRLLGIVCEPKSQPTARIRDSAWAATPVDRLAQLCRHHEVPLGLATDGRWWALVWAPRGGVTTTAVFDAVGWAEAADRHVVRAFRSLLCRTRFFGVPEAEQLVTLLKESEGKQEDITDALGVQVRQAVELLVAAMGRADARERAAGGRGLAQVSAHDVYRGAVSVMMRVVFLLFAEERRLLPSDNELYANAYSAGRLCAELEQRAVEGTEEELERSTAAWHRLRALFTAVYSGIDHPRLHLHAHDGSLFDPDTYPWLPDAIDDRTVMRMLSAVQHVEIGAGKNRERRTLSFRQLDVEQIGYVYEGLLSFDGLRADGVVVGLVGKQGMEEEVPLAELEVAAGDGLAATLAERYKSSGIGSVRALEKRLVALNAVETEEARKKLLAVTDGDYPLVERLLPFHGLLRRDLRDLPVVVLPGALYVTESKLRKNTGTHYTPRTLATEIVEHALEPLLYHIGPLQTADRSQWTHKSSAELLQLKVADIAMGSAAFLVAAARYLGDALLTAWAREGQVDRSPCDETVALDADEDPLVIEARRQVIEHCLYGVDINSMAVEMAKLSLWLVSMDNVRPFTFLDDRLLAGDALLGITSLDQLEHLHMNPVQGRELHQDLFDWTAGVREQVARIAELRREIATVELGDDPIGALEYKRALLEDAQLESGRLRLLADLTVGAALSHAGRGTNGLVAGSIAAARLANDVSAGHGEVAAREQRRDWLSADQPDGAFDRNPLHWPLIFPEVYEHGGFDAIIGNPPFLGGTRITRPLGIAYREYLIEAIAGGVRAGGRCDLVAYFVLRAHDLLSPVGQAGLVATNSLAQGDTREVGLDQIESYGSVIRRALSSRPWPAKSANIEYCAVWLSRVACEGVKPVLDDVSVKGISSSLEPLGRSPGRPFRLRRQCLVSEGVKLTGMGFALPAGEARDLIEQDVRYKDVLFPYLSGKELNTDLYEPRERWIIDFGDRDEEEARAYPAVFKIVEERVKPERQRLKPNGDYVLRAPLPQRYWQLGDKRTALKSAISQLGDVIAIALVSSTVMPEIVHADQAFSNKVIIFASDDRALFALLSSSVHYWWAVTNSSTLRTDLAYAPSDVFETLPMPDLSDDMRALGQELHNIRKSAMIARRTGLTKLYQIVSTQDSSEADIKEVRRLHREIDLAVIKAYGWEDRISAVGGLAHGFYSAGRATRFTIGVRAQREILDSLLELNHDRYSMEVAQGLHHKKGRGPKAHMSSDGGLF